MARPALHLAQNPEADALLSADPLALLIGMVLDQQVPLEWAFGAPLELRRRLGTDLDAGRLAALEPDSLVAVFSERPALHRYPGAMAKRVQELCRVLTDAYGGRAEAVWEDVGSGAELLRRVQALPGFGAQKAKIFVALLGKQQAVRPPGWKEVSAPYSEPGSFRSAADIVDETSLGKVRAFKQDMKALAKQAEDPAKRARAAAKPARAAAKPASNPAKAAKGR